MRIRLKGRSARFNVESLEARELLSHIHPLPAAIHRPALVSRYRPAITTNPAGIAAVTSALEGGLGREWVALVHSQIRNPLAVITGFATGKYTSYTIKGLTAQTPTVQPLFTGQPYDQLLATVAGASVFKRNVLELGAIMRGPFHDPAPSYYVFGLNRGAGASLGPVFPSRPGITPDALVTLTVGPYGTTASGTITDLVTQATQVIAPANIKIVGPVVRVYLNTAQLPSHGWPLAKYHFAFWTQTQPGHNISTVASFAPANSMIPIDIVNSVAPTH